MIAQIPITEEYWYLSRQLSVLIYLIHPIYWIGLHFCNNDTRLETPGHTEKARTERPSTNTV